MLPVTLPNGVLAIYGMGTKVSSTGIVNIDEQSPMRYGTVYQIYDGGEVFIYGGSNVMFNNNEIVCRVVSENIPYTLVPARLVTKESPLL
jgi:hypothetical protein